MSGEFRTILADPAWPYRQFSDSAQGAVKAQYDTMSIDDICAIPVADKFAHKNSILLLWSTWPHVDNATRVMQAWGFEHVTGCPWIKTSPSTGSIYTGIGFWFQSCSEYLLVGKRGKGKRKKGGKSTLGLLVDFLGERAFCSPRKKHSEKPFELYSWVEYNLDGPYLELFARQKWNEKWTAYGLDLGYKLTANGAEPYAPATEVVK